MKILDEVVSFIPTTTQDVLTNELFAAPIKLHTQSALDTLVQNGVGTHCDVMGNPELTWEDFFGDKIDNTGVGFAKQYIFTKVQLLFDPPMPSAISILEKVAEETLWRARTEFDDYDPVTTSRRNRDEVGNS